MLNSKTKMINNRKRPMVIMQMALPQLKVNNSLLQSMISIKRCCSLGHRSPGRSPSLASSRSLACSMTHRIIMICPSRCRAPTQPMVVRP